MLLNRHEKLCAHTSEASTKSTLPKSNIMKNTNAQFAEAKARLLAAREKYADLAHLDAGNFSRKQTLNHQITHREVLIKRIDTDVARYEREILRLRRSSDRSEGIIAAHKAELEELTDPKFAEADRELKEAKEAYAIIISLED